MEEWEAREKARAAVEKEGWSFRRAADYYDVPLSTLYRHVKKAPTAPVKHGKETLLTHDHEAGLVESILWRSKRGMCMDDDELRFLARQVVLRSGKTCSEASPTRRWVDSFMKRHKATVTKRKSQILSVRRFQESSEDSMRRYFKNLEEAVGDLGPSRVWNCDESGFCPQGRSGGRVLCGKGMNANVLRSGDKENVSLMACVSADGSSLPSMFIFPGKTRQLEWMDGTHEDAVCAVTETSYINSNIFFHRLKFFDRQITKRGITRPVLLFMDGHFSHISQFVLDYAIENKIDLFVLPAQTSHFTQPLDNTVFRSLKAGYETQLRVFPFANRGDRPKRKHLAHLVTTAWDTCVKPNTIITSFKNTGVYPPNLDIILTKCIGDKAPVNDLPHVARLLATDHTPLLPLYITRSLRDSLAQDDYSPETLSVVFVAAEMSSSLSPPKDTKERKRTIVDGGGVVITKPEIVQVLKENARAKELAAELKQQQKDQREQAKVDRKRKLERAAEDAKKKALTRQFDRDVKKMMKEQQQKERKQALAAKKLEKETSKSRTKTPRANKSKQVDQTRASPTTCGQVQFNTSTTDVLSIQRQLNFDLPGPPTAHQEGNDGPNEAVV